MGIKSRGNWAIQHCFKKCANRDKKCDDCFTRNGKPTKYKPKEVKK